MNTIIHATYFSAEDEQRRRIEPTEYLLQLLRYNNGKRICLMVHADYSVFNVTYFLVEHEQKERIEPTEYLLQLYNDKRRIHLMTVQIYTTMHL